MDISPLEIILVEDDMNDAELAIRALKKNNIVNKLIHLKDGEEAIDYIFTLGKYAERNPGNIPGLILLDLKMPRMSGIEVLKRFKNDQRTSLIPIVVLTSSKENPDVKECSRLGVNSYIVKPIEFENFVEAVALTGFYWILLNNPPMA